MEAPKCKYCNNIMTLAGGTIGGYSLIWACWRCNYELEDIECEELEQIKKI